MYQLKDILASANTAGDIRRFEDKIYSANYNYIKEYNVKTLKSLILPFELTSNIKYFDVSADMVAVVDFRNILHFFNKRFTLLRKLRLYECDFVEFSYDGYFVVYATGRTVTVMRTRDFRIAYTSELSFRPRRAFLSPNNDCLVCIDPQNVVVLPVVFYLTDVVKSLSAQRELLQMFALKRFAIDTARPVRRVFCVPNGENFNVLEHVDALLAHSLSEEAYYAINERYSSGSFASFDLLIVYVDSEIYRWAPGVGAAVLGTETALEGYSWFLQYVREIPRSEIGYGVSSGHFKIECAAVGDSGLVLGYSTGECAVFDLELSLVQSASLSAYPLTSVLAAGEFVAAASRAEKSVRVFNTSSGVVCFEDQTVVNMSAIDLSPDSRYLACGQINGEVLIFDVFRNALHARFYAHNGDVRALQFMSTSKALVSAGQDSVIAYDLKKAQIFRTFTTAYNMFECVAVDPSGEIVAASDAQFQVNLFDLRSGIVLDYCRYHEGPITKLQFSPSGNGELFSTSWDKTLRIMDCFAAGKPIETVQETAEITGFQLIDGGNIAVFLANGNLDVFEIETARYINSINLKPFIETGVMQKNFKSRNLTAFAAIGDLLFLGGYSKYLLVLRLTEGRVLRLEQRIYYSINIEFANIDSDDVLEQKRQQKTYMLPEDQEIAAITREVDMRTRKLLDPIAQLENRKMEARIVQICVSADQKRVFAATSFGVLVFSCEKYIQQIEIGCTREAATYALQSGEYAKAAAISSILHEKDLALRAFLEVEALQNAAAELALFRSFNISAVLEMLTEFVLDSHAQQLVRIVRFAAALLVALQGHLKAHAAAASGLNAALKAKTEDMRIAGVKALYILRAAQRYSDQHNEAQIEQFNAQVVAIKIKRKKEEMARMRAKEEAP